MNEILENIAGFLSLGSRSVVNQVKTLSLNRQKKKNEKDIHRETVLLGRASWEFNVISADSFPSVEKLQNSESMIDDKQKTITDIDQQIAQLKEQRDKHIAHYDRSINEQMGIKRPVDTELTDLLIEIKRLKRELAITLSEIKTLDKKNEVLTKRGGELEDTAKESNQYLQKEITQEIELNRRSRTLKEEKAELIRKTIDDMQERADKIKVVVKQYDDEITELKTTQRELLTRIKGNINDLVDMRSKVEVQIKRIKGDMEPILANLGMAVKAKGIKSDKLTNYYSNIDRLEKDREIFRKEIERLRTDSASIGLGIKIGFLALLGAGALLFIWLLFLIF